jgi:hypothetical protein
MWKTIEIDLHDWEINEYGIIRHRKTHAIKGEHISAAGYRMASFTLMGCTMAVPVHQLVAEYFVDNPQNKTVVHHKDFDKTNNHASNLEWLTKQEHGRIHGAAATEETKQKARETRRRNQEAKEEAVKRGFKILESIYKKPGA